PGQLFGLGEQLERRRRVALSTRSRGGSRLLRRGGPRRQRSGFLNARARLAHRTQRASSLTTRAGIHARSALEERLLPLIEGRRTGLELSRACGAFHKPLLKNMFHPCMQGRCIMKQRAEPYQRGARLAGDVLLVVILRLSRSRRSVDRVARALFYALEPHAR